MKNIIIIIAITLFTTTVVSFAPIANSLYTFTESYAQLASITPTTNQSQQQQVEQLADTIKINLSDIIYERELIGESILYREIESIHTNVSELEGIKARGDGNIFPQVSAREGYVAIAFSAILPNNPQNPNGENILLDVDMTLDVNFIDTKPDGLKIYYLGLGAAPGYIGNFQVEEGVLEQTSQEDAVLSLVLEQK